MKFGAVTKLVKRNKKPSKRFDDGVMLANCDVIVIFRFMANLEQPGSRTPDTQSVNITFSIRLTLHLAKTENRTKKSPTQLLHYGFE